MSLDQLLAGGDEAFDGLYPPTIRELATDHWSPVAVAKEAAAFLAPNAGVKVLDIGSGVGKFCIIGAATTAGHFTGVEQRPHLVDLSREVAASLKLPNLSFIASNVTQLSFEPYDAFYFFNSFHENRSPLKQIDAAVETSTAHYAKYSAYVTRELAKTRPGTRLVTYWTCLWDIPTHFRRQHSAFDGLLDFWEKIA